MTIQEFKLVDPGADYILFFYSGTPTASISAVNISNVDCNGKNIYSVFSPLTNLLIPINGVNYNFTVTSRTLYTNYAHFTVEPISVSTSNLVNEGSCTDIVTVPTLLSSEFGVSDYQALLNNASDNRSVDFIYKVDRNKLTISASNINAINAGNAELADYQELNYSSVGLTNSRYGGSKTTTLEYGLSPALTGVLVDGSVYNPTVANGYICSQSISDRNLEELVIGYNASSETSFKGTVLYTEDLKINYELVAKFYLGSNIPSGSTSITLNSYVDVNSGDIIRFKQGSSKEEILKVESVPSKTSTSTQLVVTRAYKSEIDPNNNAKTFYASGTLAFSVSKLTGTILFKPGGNRLYRISNRKIWIKENSKIFYVDEAGQVIFELITCSI